MNIILLNTLTYLNSKSNIIYSLLVTFIQTLILHHINYHFKNRSLNHCMLFISKIFIRPFFKYFNYFILSNRDIEKY